MTISQTPAGVLTFGGEFLFSRVQGRGVIGADPFVDIFFDRVEFFQNDGIGCFINRGDLFQEGRQITANLFEIIVR